MVDRILTSHIFVGIIPEYNFKIAMVGVLFLRPIEPQVDCHPLLLEGGEGLHEPVVLEYVFHVLGAAAETLGPTCVETLIPREVIVVKDGVVAEVLAVGALEGKLEDALQTRGAFYNVVLYKNG